MCVLCHDTGIIRKETYPVVIVKWQGDSKRKTISVGKRG